MTIKEEIRTQGLALGFTSVGFCAAGERPEYARLRRWLNLGYAAGMRWMWERQRERSDPTVLAPWVRTLVMATLSYGEDPPRREGTSGQISRYARGKDYHQILKDRLVSLAERVKQIAPGTRVSAVVDTGAIMEKPWAAATGLGWQGKHTNLIDPRAGSWLFLGELLIDLDLEPDDTPVTDQCGSCTRCLDACPTGAFPAPYVLDSRRCISYLTIEHRGSIPEELRTRMEDWIFGCDICQEVCPWNQAPHPADAETGQTGELPGLPTLLGLGPDDFRQRFSGSAIRRAGWQGFVRNVAVALGHSGDPAAVTPLEGGLKINDPVVREHVVWALGRLGTERARNVLARHRVRESEPTIREAISRALNGTGDPAPSNEARLLSSFKSKREPAGGVSD